MKIIIFLALCLAAANASLLDVHEWNTLRVTWSPNLISSWTFDKLPRKLSENKDFEFKDDLCKTGNGKLVGQRYWYKQDPTLFLLFDKNGFVAGIQSSILKSKFTPPAKLQDKNYLDDGDYWTLSAYFIDPSLICGAGRSEEEFKKTGTATGLWVQVGPNALTDTFNVPQNEDDIKKTKWGYGKCYYTMGQHYWYNVTKDMSSNDFVPNCLLYNGGKLNAFCFAVNGYFDSKRYDNPHPTNKTIGKFMDPEPNFFFKDPAFGTESTMHIYFSEKPELTSWC